MTAEEGVVPLSRWRAVLARSRNPKKRLELVLGDPQAAELVERIPIEELYYLVRGVGLEDAIEVLRLASPEQIQGCLDLDLWQRDRLATTRVFAWLEVLAELPPQVLMRAMRALDAELIALVVGRYARIYDRSVGEAPDDESSYAVYVTSDSSYLVEMRTSNSHAARVLERFVDRLYNADPDVARKILSDAKWGMTTELEEESYRWRTARMADMGFPSYEDALGVYRELDPGTAPPPAGPIAYALDETRMLPAPIAETLGGDSLFERALAEVDDATLLGDLSTALVALLNRVMVADRVDPVDLDVLRETTARVRDTLSLGLDHLAGGDPSRTTALLAQISLFDLFRVGYSLTLVPARRARALERQGVIDPNVDAMLGPRPLYPRALDAEPMGGERAFRSLEDLRKVETYLDEVASQNPPD